ncbi:TPA: aminoacyl-tRNA deacylase [Candidatus Bathyarchaeota archaeon]|nr:aminoacyl-tRNA deacylase [Candidatus Bathyarchaeota archaeon]
MPKFPVTPATTHLDKLGIIYEKHTYDYARKGSDIAADGLGVGLHEVVKTLIMQRDGGEPIVVLQHGDKEVNLKDLARQIGAKNVESCEVKDAQRHTGYLVGGISPFGTRRQMSVYAEESILQLPKFYINGGQRGFILEMTPAEIQKALTITTVKVAR